MKRGASGTIMRGLGGSVGRDLTPRFRATILIFPLCLSLSLSPFLPSAGAADSSPAPVPFELTDRSCLSAGCHAVLKEPRFVHAPVIQEDCHVCHEAALEEIGGNSVPMHDFKTRQPDLAFCGSCHTTLTHDAKVVHGPFRENCVGCHNPHSGGARYFLKVQGSDNLCHSCHADLTAGMAFLHAPVILNACNSCHTPHLSEYEGLLSRPPDKLCVFCHYEFQKGMDKAVSVHAPMREACYECHNPHGGPSRGLLPASQSDMCRQCHEALFATMESVQYPHAAMIENKNCSDCHNPHWAESAKLLNRPSLDLCLSCHNDAIETPGGRRIAAVGRQIADNPYRHGPIEQGDCTPCHATHGNNDPRLMKKSFPTEFYAPYQDNAYELCFGCHNQDLIKAEYSQSTGFRNGDRNLHYAHVHQEKGRSCRACHHEHASQTAFHIRDRVAFGQWELEIKFEKLDDGGVCFTGCHTERRYDRSNPVTYGAGNGGQP